MTERVHTWPARPSASGHIAEDYTPAGAYFYELFRQSRSKKRPRDEMLKRRDEEYAKIKLPVTTTVINGTRYENRGRVPGGMWVGENRGKCYRLRQTSKLPSVQKPSPSTFN